MALTLNNLVASLTWTKCRLLFSLLVILVTWILAIIELCLCNQIKHHSDESWAYVVSIGLSIGVPQFMFAWPIAVFQIEQEEAAAQNINYNPSANHGNQSWWRRMRGGWRGYVATGAGFLNQAASLAIVAVVVANMTSTVHDKDTKTDFCGYDIHYFWSIECLVIWCFFWSIYLKAGPYMDCPLAVFTGLSIQIASQIKDEADPHATIKCPHKPYKYVFGLSIALGVIFILVKNAYGLYLDLDRARRERNAAAQV